MRTRDSALRSLAVLVAGLLVAVWAREDVRRVALTEWGAPATLVGPVDAPLAGTVVLEGRVVDGDGAPIAGAEVVAIPDGPARAADGAWIPPYLPFIGLGVERPHLQWDVALADPRWARTRTDDDGAFRVTTRRTSRRVTGGAMTRGLPEPLVVVRAPGRAVAVVEPAFMRDADAPVARVRDVTLLAESVVTGRVVDDVGRPVAGATVRLEGALLRFPRSDTRRLSGGLAALLPELHATTTDGDGRYTLRGQWPCRAELSAIAPGHARAVTDGIEVPEASDLEVGTLELPPGETVAGRVVDAHGAPRAGVRVFATTAPRGYAGHGCVVGEYRPSDDSVPLELEECLQEHVLRARTDADGRFAFRELPRERVSLYAAGPGLEPTRLDTDPGTLDARLVVSDAARWRVRVLDPAGRLLEGARAFAFRHTGTMEDPPCDVTRDGDRLVVDTAGPLGTRLEVRAPGHARAFLVLPGLAAGEARDLDVTLAPERRLLVRLVDADGAPVTSDRVLVHTVDATRSYPPALAGGATDASGEVLFGELAAGPVSVSATVELPADAPGADAADPSRRVEVQRTVELPAVGTTEVVLVAR